LSNALGNDKRRFIGGHAANRSSRLGVPVQVYDELRGLAGTLETTAETLNKHTPALDALEKAAKQVDLSFSGSWLGYHAYVYYGGLDVPPAGANFSPEWGLKAVSPRHRSQGDWEQHDPFEVIARIYDSAGVLNMDDAKQAQKDINTSFEKNKSEILSILHHEAEKKNDKILRKLIAEIEAFKVKSAADFQKQVSPKNILSRDSLAVSQGIIIPPHYVVLCEAGAIRYSALLCNETAKLALQAASHLERSAHREVQRNPGGGKVFIGHGRSHIWRELKDFLQDRLGLLWDEFNRVPAAGITTVQRLSQMLDDADIAFLIMTAEDEMADGGLQARMNVVHEVGLFQGRLGFPKAIILLEEGCEEFSNISGLVQIRFPKGNIEAVFEKVRAVLDRENVTGNSA
jgi:predicted nucleotide-binding protein